MRLSPGYTRFFGQPILSIFGDELRKSLRRLRRQLFASRLNEAEETFEEMIKTSNLACDPVAMRQAITDQYAIEWEWVGLPNT